ncbi:MAG: NAD(P)-binding domain-containing protein [Fibrobacteres bacterium]|nr:NAD(P)-binding domain-containing protein [Fibrobacterota bacterium]
MRIPIVGPYFRWLQKGNPTGTVERYPEIDSDYRSSIPGLYIVGDLTGVPLLKLASESGARAARHILADPDFVARQGRGEDAHSDGGEGGNKAGETTGETTGEGRHDVLIIGAGPAGLACALAFARAGADYLVLESSRPFSTIENFPAGKPILAKPDGYAAVSPLAIRDGSKESLLADLHGQIDGQGLKLRAGVRVDRIRRDGNRLRVETSRGGFSALRVVLAIGKTGDARRLGIPGEDLPHVSNRLIDPGDFHGKSILVAGGGDTAVEAACALAEAGNQVTLAYRGGALSRPKPENRERLEFLREGGRIETAFGSVPKAIRPGEAVLSETRGEGPPGERTLAADQVFVLIGRELPIAFLKRSGIRLAGGKDAAGFVFLAAMLAFFCMVYFGKAGAAHDVFRGVHGLTGTAWAYLTVPFRPDLARDLPWSLHHYSWYPSLCFLLGWAGSLAFLIAGPVALIAALRRRRRYFGTPWARFKSAYFIAVAVFFAGIYFRFLLGQTAGWSEAPTYWYSLLYSLTVIVFGLRRMAVKKTRYIRRQMLVLMAVQVFFLFLLPFHLFDPLIKSHFAADSWLMREVFPAGKYSCFGLVLFWPLDMNDFGRSAFWTWFPFVQTFGILFFIVWRWGKGAYCGWICSCGGMAEALGDESREQAPHGKGPKRMDNIGQVVLAAALALTAAGYASRHLGAGPLWLDTFRGVYKLGIDVFFAGVLGLGLYFFLSGRVWCRFGCPLAALMHVYARFSRFRIFAEKKKCISCNICTKSCHMGIDVMNYANQGIPMNDVQCVRCSACVQACPTETLAFGSIRAQADPENRGRQEAPDFPKQDWKAGIR